MKTALDLLLQSLRYRVIVGANGAGDVFWASLVKGHGEYGRETWVYVFEGQEPTLESALDALRERVKCHYERIIDCGDGCYGRGEDVPHGIPQEKICQAPDTGCLADGSGDAI